MAPLFLQLCLNVIGNSQLISDCMVNPASVSSHCRVHVQTEICLSIIQLPLPQQELRSDLYRTGSRCCRTGLSTSQAC